MTRPPYAKHGGRKLAVTEKCPCDTCTAYLAEHRRKQAERNRARYPRTPKLPPATVNLQRPAGQACKPRCERGECGICDGHRDADAAYMRSRRAVATILPNVNQAWRDDALCTQTDPETFFPEKGGTTAGAKRVCVRCPVQAQCLEYALANNEHFGVWGGYSERERREIARGRAA